MPDRPVDPPMVGTGPQITCSEFDGGPVECSIDGCSMKARYAICIATVGVLHACPGCRARVLASARASYGSGGATDGRAIDRKAPGAHSSFGGS